MLYFVITKLSQFVVITNCDSLVYCKKRWTVIANCDSCYVTTTVQVQHDLLRQVTQSAMIITNCTTAQTSHYL